jgi:hypothetical protein
MSRELVKRWVTKAVKESQRRGLLLSLYVIFVAVTQPVFSFEFRKVENSEKIAITAENP